MSKIERFKILPQGPKGKLFTGNLRDFQKDPLGFLSRLPKEYGEAAKFRFGPFQKVYLVTNPELIKQVLVTKQKSFVKSRDFKALKPLMGEGLLTSEKDYHMRQRRLIQPAFKKSHISSYGQDMIDITRDYMSSWEDGQKRNITQDMMGITLGIITKTMFSMTFKEGYDSIGEPLETAMKSAIKRMRATIKLPLWVPVKSNRKYRSSIKKLDSVLYDIISRRRKQTERYDDMLDILMDAKDAEDGRGMTDEQVRDELMTIFLAGHETTANALSWAMYLLSQHPEAEQKLFQEIDAVIGDRPPAPEDFMKLPYTQNVIWETMRLFPPSFVTGREAEEDVEIGEYSFKKGDTILVSQYVMHRDPKYFEQADSFIPERFENNYLKTLPPYAYFPFGGGARVCIGNHFAVMEAVLVLACIAQRYRLRLAPDHHEVKPFPSITLRPRRGLQMIAEERVKADLPLQAPDA
ncbi:Cytochrome P450 [Bacillus sp. OV322]|uniref:cytochrome P450 n=1 Tax=Bacillus sp. OV322 TaxID=1882764 RepID=UPI0008F3A496|nr:cytochrome P450 [Bacillus sp. OV322]SFC25230.1 Cytochrome P450 [Bacillus sp. OV322]